MTSVPALKKVLLSKEWWEIQSLRMIHCLVFVPCNCLASAQPFLDLAPARQCCGDWSLNASSFDWSGGVGSYFMYRVPASMCNMYKYFLHIKDVFFTSGWGKWTGLPKPKNPWLAWKCILGDVCWAFVGLFGGYVGAMLSLCWAYVGPRKVWI